MPIDRTPTEDIILNDTLELARRFRVAAAADDLLAALTEESPGYWDGAAECPECEGAGITAPDPTPTIYVQFSDDGQFIRKWSFEPFEAGARYVPAFVPWWDNPDGPQAA